MNGMKKLAISVSGKLEGGFEIRAKQAAGLLLTEVGDQQGAIVPHGFAGEPGEAGLASRTGPNLACPTCDSIIYSRRNKHCGVCGQDLPVELLFNAIELQRIEGIIESEKLRHRKWMSRANAAMPRSA